MKKIGTYICPLCERKVTINEIVLSRKQKDPFHTPIICVTCVMTLYHSMLKGKVS